jgi:uncharacterized protein (DUF302 family)
MVQAQITPQTEIGYTVTLDRPFDEAVALVTEELKKEGFGILTQADMQAAFKDKLGKAFPRYLILGACNPGLAFQALNIDREVGLLLPCNVIVYENGGGVTVSIIDPIAMMDVLGNPALDEVASDANDRLERVFLALQSA